MPIVLHALLGTLTILCAPKARAVTIFESATLGPTGQFSGVGVDAGNFLGVRFQISSPVTTGRIGGHFGRFEEPQEIFAAVVALSGPLDFPDSALLSTPDVLGTALMPLPSPSDELSSQLVLSLTPGWYAMVFGWGLFGTAGGPPIPGGFAPSNNSDVGSPSYFSIAEPMSADPVFSDGGFSNTRFFLETVPEPSLLLLLATGLVVLASRRGRLN